MKKVVLRLDLQDNKDKQKAMKAVSTLLGIDFIAMDMKNKRIIVIGDVDPVKIASKLRKNWHAEIVSVQEGSPKEEPKKVEAEKEEPKKEEPKKEEEAKKEEPKVEEPKKDEAKKDDTEKPKEESKKEEEKKRDPNEQMMELVKSHRAYNYNPYMTTPNPYRAYNYSPYFVPSAEDNPNACVIS